MTTTTTKSKLKLSTSNRYPSEQAKLGPAPFASFDQEQSIDGGDYHAPPSSSSSSQQQREREQSTIETRLPHIKEHSNKNRSLATTPTTPHIAVSPASTLSSTSSSNSEHDLFHERLFKLESRELRSSTEELPITTDGEDEVLHHHGKLLLSPRDEMLRRSSQPMVIGRRGSTSSPIDDLLGNSSRKWSLDSRTRPKSSASIRSHSPYCINYLLETSFCGSRPIPTRSMEREEELQQQKQTISTVLNTQAVLEATTATEAPPTNSTTAPTTTTSTHQHASTIFIESSFIGKNVSLDSCSHPFDKYRGQESVSSIGSVDVVVPTVNYSLDSPPHSSSHWSPYSYSAKHCISESVVGGDPVRIVVGGGAGVRGSVDEEGDSNTRLDTQTTTKEQSRQPMQQQFNTTLSSSSSESSLSSLPSLPTTLPTSRPTTTLTPSSLRCSTSTSTAIIERPRPTTREPDKSKLVEYIQKSSGGGSSQEHQQQHQQGSSNHDNPSSTSSRHHHHQKINIKLPNNSSIGSLDEEDRKTSRRVSDWGQFAEKLQSPSRLGQQGRRGSSK